MALRATAALKFSIYTKRNKFTLKKFLLRLKLMFAMNIAPCLSAVFVAGSFRQLACPPCFTFGRERLVRLPADFKASITLLAILSKL
jgi:hypothetical protein